MLKLKLAVFYLILCLSLGQVAINFFQISSGMYPRDQEWIPLWRTFGLHSIVFILPGWFTPRPPFELHYGNEIREVDWYREFRPRIDYHQATLFIHSWFAGPFEVEKGVQKYFCDATWVKENLGLPGAPDLIVTPRPGVATLRTSCAK